MPRLMMPARTGVASPRRGRTAASRAITLLPRGLIAGLLVIGLPSPARPQEASLEAAVKATYLCKLAEFVTWPAPADASPDFELCIVGLDPFGALLDRVVQGQTVHRKPVTVRRLAAVTPGPACHLVFAAGSRTQPVAAILAAVKGTPVLTVTDEQVSPDATGIINLMVVDGRVRFAIDQGAAAANHLTISSKLLSLAVQVHGPGP